jgi:glucose-6-phosphate 1-dehydrogenase
MKSNSIVNNVDKPVTLVIFGITGDLARNKLLPALFELWKNKKIPKNFRIIGVGRRPFTDDELRREINSSLPKKSAKVFLSLVSYIYGNFDDPALYSNLKSSETAKLFYLAVPPNLYETVLPNLPVSSRDKVLVEKPFGTDVKSAKSLTLLCEKHFKTNQVYLIDHYLGKESVQKLGTLKLAPSYIEKIEINIFEKNGVGSRGAFYDKIGALNDVGQNHLLQILNQLARPGLASQKTLIFKHLKVSRRVLGIRGQYRGYLNEAGVNRNSDTETFFRIGVEIKTGKWRNVLFILSSGKKMKVDENEIKIYFKNKKTKILKIGNGGYEKVFLDSLAGDHKIFPSADETLEQWRFIEKARKKLEKKALQIY